MTQKEETTKNDTEGDSAHRRKNLVIQKEGTTEGDSAQVSKKCGYKYRHFSRLI